MLHYSYMITDYLNINLIEALELQNLPQDQKEALATKMAQVAESRLLMAVYTRLSDDDAAELDKLMDSDASDADLYAFLNKKIPDLNLLASEVLANLKKQLLETYANARV